MATLNPIPTKWNQWLGWISSPDKGWCMYTGYANRVGYLNSVLAQSAQNTSPGNKYFSVATRTGVQNFKAWWGIGGNPQVCDSATWAVIDYYAWLTQFNG